MKSPSFGTFGQIVRLTDELQRLNNLLDKRRRVSVVRDIAKSLRHIAELATSAAEYEEHTLEQATKTAIVCQSAAASPTSPPVSTAKPDLSSTYGSKSQQ